jgi:hypothetical protein
VREYATGPFELHTRVTPRVSRTPRFESGQAPIRQ